MEEIRLARAAQALFRAIETIRGELADLSGLSLTELRALTLIAGSTDDVHPSEVASALNVGLSATTSISDRLVQQGLIERSPDPGDRRKVILRATETGMEISDRADHLFISRISSAAQGLDPEAVLLLTDTMSRITSRLR